MNRIKLYEAIEKSTARVIMLESIEADAALLKNELDIIKTLNKLISLSKTQDKLTAKLYPIK